MSSPWTLLRTLHLPNLPTKLRPSILPTSIPIPTRTFTTSSPLHNNNNDKLMGSNPQANQPNSINADVRKDKDTPNTDSQSNASQQEHKSGGEHPAKQSDQQAQPGRSTGIGGQTEVEGGKKGEQV